MLHYPKMPGSGAAPLERCIAFEKYDGTNFHWDWDRDFGWHAFGTRRDCFDLTPAGIAAFTAKHAHLHEAPALFLRALAGPLEAVLRENPIYAECAAINVFTEFLGPNSFAGLHRAEDPKELRLIDIEREPGGFVGPWRFVKDFVSLPIARVVHEGKLTGQFAEDVRRGKYSVAEGVVCKGGTEGEVWRVKIKTYAYLAKLKAAFADRWEDYWE
jgi:hypothetical protein